MGSVSLIRYFDALQRFKVSGFVDFRVAGFGTGELEDTWGFATSGLLASHCILRLGASDWAEAALLNILIKEWGGPSQAGGRMGLRRVEDELRHRHTVASFHEEGQTEFLRTECLSVVQTIH